MQTLPEHKSIALAAAVAVALLCATAAPAQTPRQSTAQSTIVPGAAFDAAKPGFTALATGPPQRQYRRELPTARAQPGRTKRRRSLTYFAYLTDFQLADEESPARIDSLAPVQHNTSAWRPQEALAPATIDAIMQRLNSFTEASPNRGAGGSRAPMDLALLGGDQADNQQQNETTWVRQLVEGGQTLDPNSGISNYSKCTVEQREELATRPLNEAARYTGLQDYDDYNGGSGDGNFYDPDSPSGAYAQWPTYAGLMDSAQRPFVPVGLRRGQAPVPTYVTNGNHDGEVQGFVTAGRTAERIATGCFKPYIQDPGTNFGPNYVFDSGSGFAVPPDPRRRFVDRRDVKRIFAQGSQSDAHGFGYVDPAQNTASAGSASYYAWTPRPGVRFISLDTLSEGTGTAGGAEGNLDDPQYQWLRGELRQARRAKQIVVVFGHHPIRRLTAATPDEAAGQCGGGPGCDSDPRVSTPLHLQPDIQQLFDSSPNVVAYLSGHTHANRIRPCADRCRGRGNWWAIETSSSIDWPQQQRLLEVMDNRDGTLSLLGTLVDHAAPVAAPASIGDRGSTSALGIEQLAALSRVFSYNDPRTLRQAGGATGDRNVELMVRDPRAGRGAGLCTGVTTKLSGATVDRATLGRARSANRRAFTRYSLTAASRTLDRYCLVGGGNLRVGYVRNRAAVALSSGKANRLGRLKVGSRTSTVRRRLRGEHRYRLGPSTLYVARGSRSLMVVEVRNGRVRQLGLAAARLASSRKRTAALLGRFF